MSLLRDGFVLYVLGLFIAPNLKAGHLRRALEVLYWPFVYLGLWHRWSMYSPDVPDGTRIALTVVVQRDGSSEVVPLPGFDDDRGFGKAWGLRFISFQYGLSDPSTDYLKPALCDYALRRWRSERNVGDEREPVAVEIREYWYPSPAPGRREKTPEPVVRTIWRESVEADG